MTFKHQIGTNHDPSSALASLTMDCCHILGVSIQKVIAVHTKLEDHIKRRRVVIIKRIILTNRVFVEVAPVILTLRAQVVYLVMLIVLLPEESLDVSDAISVHSFGAFRGESHCDHSICDVAEV